MKDIHIFIHDDLDQRLGRIAEANSRKKAHVVREAVTEYVARKERELIQQEMKRYAEDLAPASATLAAETAKEVNKVLSRETEW